MSDASADGPAPGGARRPHPRDLSATYLEWDLDAELAQLRREGPWPQGHTAKTLAKYDDLRVVLVALTQGARIPEHRAGGRITLQAVAGRLQVHAAGRTFDLPAGRVLALERGVPHDVVAVEEGALLLTIAWGGRESD